MATNNQQIAGATVQNTSWDEQAHGPFPWKIEVVVTNHLYAHGTRECVHDEDTMDIQGVSSPYMHVRDTICTPMFIATQAFCHW
jgi:hypothetical protein